MANLVLDPHARELAKKLDGLPLALATAGAYLSQVTTSWEDYLCSYNTSWLKLQKTSPGLPSYEDRALYSTWNISYDHIRRQNENAAKLLQLWAYFDNEDLWYKLLAGQSIYGPEWFLDIVGDELSFNEVIRLLFNHALIEPRGTSGGYGMHSCVHAWTRYALNAEQDTPMAILALYCVASAVPDENVRECWILGRRLLPHANRCLEFFNNSMVSALENSEHIPWVLNSLGYLYDIQGEIKKATIIYIRALAGYEKALGPEHTTTLDTVHNLGTLYLNQGKLKEAEKLYLRALAGYKKVFGPKHITMLDTVIALGVLYSGQGRTRKAEKLYMRALVGFEKALGPEHISTLTAVYNLGILYDEQGKLKKAEEIYLRVLAGYEKALGPEHTTTLNAISNLGNLYKNQDKLKEAEEIFLRALAGFEKALGPEHIKTLDTVYNLGYLYSNQGKLKEAEEMFLRTLAGYKKAFGPEHKSPMETRYILAVLYAKQCLWEDAAKQLELVVPGFIKLLGPKHYKTVTALDFLKLCQRQLRGSIDGDSGEAPGYPVQEDGRSPTDRPVSRGRDSSDGDLGSSSGDSDSSSGEPDPSSGESDSGSGESGSSRRESGSRTGVFGSGRRESGSRRRAAFWSKFWKGTKMKIKRIRKPAGAFGA